MNLLTSTIRTKASNRRITFKHGLSIGFVITFTVVSINRYFASTFTKKTISYSGVKNSSYKGLANFRLMDDSHSDNDDDSVSQKLREQIRVLAAVMTSPENLETRAKAVKDTWAKRCNQTIYFSTEENTAFSAIGLNLTEGYDNLTTKTIAGFAYIYEHYYNDFDWFMMVDDDTYVLMENLRYFLSSQNSSDPVYFGQQGNNSCGAGYVLSKESLRRFRQRGKNSQCRNDDGSEDVSIGRCFENLGVRIANTTHSLRRTRFHPIAALNDLQKKSPKWFCSYHALGGRKGMRRVSDYIISFHAVTPDWMLQLELYIYHMRLYGIYSKEQKLNTKSSNSSQK